MSEMKYTKIPHIEKPVSRIFFGTASDPFLEGKNCNELLDSMLALGVTAFDTARQYGLSESVLGNWMETRHNRERIVLLSKCGHHTESGEKRVNPEEMKKDLEQSLASLRTDYIDIYLLHRDDPSIPASLIVETFNDMHSKGKIRAFGGSNWTVSRIEEANEYAYKHNLIPFEVSSPNFGLAHQIADLWGGGAVTISGPSNEKAREWYRRTQIAMIAYSSLGRGLFSGKLKSTDYETASSVLDSYAMKGYWCPENFKRLRRCEILAEEKRSSVPQIAMSWIFRQGIRAFAVVNTSSTARMQENIRALNLDLTDRECRYLDLREDSFC